MENGEDPKKIAPTEFISPEAQYREVYQHLLMEVGLIWRLPPISMAVTGTVVVSAFGLPIPNWILREIVTFIGLIWSVAQAFWVWKFRKYCDLYMETLSGMESEHALRFVQRRIPLPVEAAKASKGFWCRRYGDEDSLPTWVPKRLQSRFARRLTSDYLFIYLSLGVAFLLSGLLIYNGFFLPHSWPAPPDPQPLPTPFSQGG